MVLRPPRGPPRRAVLRRTVPGPPFWPSRLRLEGDPEGRPGSVFRPGHSRGPSRRAAKKAAKKAAAPDDSDDGLLDFDSGLTATAHRADGPTPLDSRGDSAPVVSSRGSQSAKAQSPEAAGRKRKKTQPAEADDDFLDFQTALKPLTKTLASQETSDDSEDSTSDPDDASDDGAAAAPPEDEADARLGLAFDSAMTSAVESLSQRHAGAVLDTDALRCRELYTAEVDALLKPHSRPLHEIYAHYAHSAGATGASLLGVQDWLRLLHDAGLVNGDSRQTLPPADSQPGKVGDVIDDDDDDVNALRDVDGLVSAPGALFVTSAPTASTTNSKRRDLPSQQGPGHHLFRGDFSNADGRRCFGRGQMPKDERKKGARLNECLTRIDFLEALCWLSLDVPLPSLKALRLLGSNQEPRLLRLFDCADEPALLHCRKFEELIDGPLSLSAFELLHRDWADSLRDAPGAADRAAAAHRRFHLALAKFLLTLYRKVGRSNESLRPICVDVGEKTAKQQLRQLFDASDVGAALKAAKATPEQRGASLFDRQDSDVHRN
mmetsp:Transcript_34805/g.121356  ORF Transcript_34805/g.121356 Transcript_34805/m.121356 type:complete len:548 (-) Transcript_34805:104-1747(-)